MTDTTKLFIGAHTSCVQSRIEPCALATLLRYYQEGGHQPRSLSELVAWAVADLARSLVEVDLARPFKDTEAAGRLLDSLAVLTRADTKVARVCRIGRTGLSRGVRSAALGRAERGLAQEER